MSLWMVDKGSHGTLVRNTVESGFHSKLSLWRRWNRISELSYNSRRRLEYLQWVPCNNLQDNIDSEKDAKLPMNSHASFQDKQQHNSHQLQILGIELLGHGEGLVFGSGCMSTLNVFSYTFLFPSFHLILLGSSPLIISTIQIILVREIFQSKNPFRLFLIMKISSIIWFC